MLYRSQGEEATASPTPAASAAATPPTTTTPVASTDVEIRDAYLVFRALCKLSMKPVPNDSATDLRSLTMRSKLLALHLVLDVLSSHQMVFLAPAAVVTTSADQQQTVTTTTFISTVKQHLCLTLSRNLVSVIPAVFECALELFWQVLSNFRMFLKVSGSVVNVPFIRLMVYIPSGYRKRLRCFSQRSFYPFWK
jgi:brefeldin A-inhibited guanine nucleotide-exchange protein